MTRARIRPILSRKSDYTDRGDEVQEMEKRAPYAVLLGQGYCKEKDKTAGVGRCEKAIDVAICFIGQRKALFITGSFR
jgi:hypothetical protein